METQSTQQIIAEYIEIAKRGKYFIIVPVIASVIIGSSVAFKLPPVFRSKVTIFYVQAMIPEKMMVNTINIYLENAILFIKTKTFSRGNSLKIINDQHLYPDLKSKVAKEDLVLHFMGNYYQELIYTVIPSKGGKTEEIITGFEFYFEHSNPQKAFQVANILASEFIQQYKTFRESFVTQTSSFLEDEKQQLKEEILGIDKEISEFKEKNVNMLPELFQSNYRMVETLTQRSSGMDEEIRFLKEQKINLLSNIATTNPMVSIEGLSGQKIVTPEEKLASLKSELKLLKTTYSEKHPDVIRAKQEIKLLEKNFSEDSTDNRSNAGKQGYPSFEKMQQAGIFNPTYLNLITRLEEINLEIKSIKLEQEKIGREQREYQYRVDRTPLVEKDYNALARELQSAQTRYNDLVNWVLQLESSESAEKRELGGKLTMGTPPSFPLRPVKPNRPLIVAGAFFLGTILGLMMLLGWEFLTQKVRSRQDISKLTETPVLSEIPLIVSEDAGKKTNLPRHMKYVSPALLVLFVFVLLYIIHIFYMEVDVLLMRIINVLKKKIALTGL